MMWTEANAFFLSKKFYSLLGQCIVHFFIAIPRFFSIELIKVDPIRPVASSLNNHVYHRKYLTLNFFLLSNNFFHFCSFFLKLLYIWRRIRFESPKWAIKLNHILTFLTWQMLNGFLKMIFLSGPSKFSLHYARHYS